MRCGVRTVAVDDRYANTAERIEVLLGVETIALDVSPNFPHGFDAIFAKLLFPLV